MKFWKFYISLKRFFLLHSLILFLFLQHSYYVFADTIKQNDEKNLDVIELKIEENRSLKSKIQNSLNNIGEPTGSYFDLFRSSGYTFQKGPVRNQKFRYFFHGANVFTARSDKDLSNTTQFIANELQSITLFSDNKTKLMLDE